MKYKQINKQNMWVEKFTEKTFENSPCLFLDRDGVLIPYSTETRWAPTKYPPVSGLIVVEPPPHSSISLLSRGGFRPGFGRFKNPQ